MIFDELKVQELKAKLAECVEQGRLDQSVVDLIRHEKHFAPVECDVLDYKECVPTDAQGLGKTVLQAVSFHNSFGGYLVFGVAETKSETEFSFVGVPQDSVDLKQLKDKVKHYTGSTVSLSLQYFELANGSFLGLLHIPKRSAKDPLAFGKDGPGDAKNRPLFRADDIYFRNGDECIEAKGKHIAYLSGPRPNPLRPGPAGLEGEALRRVITDHNLPDKNFICPRFVGRQAVLDLLWAWFADEFSRARVLAGAGGLGKTSIAFEFAKEVCLEAADHFQKIIWLTAKKQQFSGAANVYVDVPETHFASHQELLKTLCLALGYLDSEIEGASEKMLRKMVKDGLHLSPSLIIVDDVDSLPPDEQKRVLETGMMLGGTDSRILLTTRSNQSYSNDIAITIEGMRDGDYEEYILSLRERFKAPALTTGQVQRLHDTTSGSPLFTESLFRLFKVMDPDKAIREWKGKHGEDARNAALKREVEQLTPEAKRALLSVAYLQSCSVTELMQVSGYDETLLLRLVNELNALFLVSAPQVTAEGRFSVEANTRNLVLAMRASLVVDHSSLERRATDIRKQAAAPKTTKVNWIVGAAIRQAVAFIREGKHADALDTIDVALKKQRDHPDLLYTKARCLSALPNPDHDQIRDLCRKAHAGGSHKEALFDLWYDSEWAVRHYPGALEAVEAAVAAGVSDSDRWTVKRVAALWKVAQMQESAGHEERALRDYWACAEHIRTVIKHTRQQREQDNLRARLFDVHNTIWTLAKRNASSVDGALRALDCVRKMRNLGDYRIVTLLHGCEALSELIREVLLTHGDHQQTGLDNLLDQKVREVRAAIDETVAKRPGDPKMQVVLTEFDRVCAPYVRARSG